MLTVTAIVTYLIGAMATFRNRFLKDKEQGERKRDACYKCSSDETWRHHSDWYHFDRGPEAIFKATLWPAYWTAVLAWKAMFPTGTKTRYAKQKEQEAKLKEDMANLRKQAAAYGLKIPGDSDATT